MKLLELKNIKKSYISNGINSIVLNDINLSFETGEFVCFLGNSGSGKTTLLNIIGGIDRYYEGDMLVHQNSLKSMDSKSLNYYRRTKVGFVFEDLNLMNDLSIFDNLILFMEKIHITKEQRIQRANDLLRDVGLSDCLNKKPNELSKSEVIKVAIARMITNEPDIILIDGMLDIFDEETNEDLIKILKKISAKGKLVLLFTNSNEVAKYGDRLIELKDGVVQNDIKQNENEFKQKEIKCIDFKTASEEDLEELYSDLYNLNNKSLNLLDCIKIGLQVFKNNLKGNIFVSLIQAFVISVFMIVLLTGVGLENYIAKEIYDYTNPKIIEIYKPNTKDSEDEFTAFEKIDFEKIKAIKNVESVEPIVVKNKQMKISSEETDKKTDLITLSSISKEVTDSNIYSGNTPNTDEIMISPDLASILFPDEEEFEVLGKIITISITEYNRYNNPVTIKKDLTICGLYELEPTSTQSKIGFVTYDTLEELYKKNNMPLKISKMDVYVSSEKYIEKVADNLSHIGYEIVGEKIIVNQLDKIILIINDLFYSILVIIFILALIILSTISYMRIDKRFKEISLLRLISMSNNEINNIITIQALLIGFISGIVSIIYTICTCEIINSLIYTTLGQNMITLSFNYLIIGIALTVIINLISSIFIGVKLYSK